MYYCAVKYDEYEDRSEFYKKEVYKECNECKGTGDVEDDSWPYFDNCFSNNNNCFSNNTVNIYNTAPQPVAPRPIVQPVAPQPAMVDLRQKH